MGYTNDFRNLFMVLTMLIIGTICLVKIGNIEAHSVYVTASILVPAIFSMGLLGHVIGQILDNPKNRADADYKVAVMDALKKMDKSISLQELNEKLTQKVSEPQPDNDSDSDEDDI